jgi:SAM-dependent methyltransferase
MINEILIKRSGKYDNLYRTVDYLWPLVPGRMVKHFLELKIKPGNAIDLGCGDGKNLIFLEKSGWIVDGVDVSHIAIEKAKKRLYNSQIHLKGKLINQDVLDYEYIENKYKLVVAYGLFHCLDNEQLSFLMNRIRCSLVSEGYLVFAVFNDEIPLPENHFTGELYLRNKYYMLNELKDWLPIKIEFGKIEENHYPLVGYHTHSLTWGIFKKPA